MKTKPICKWRIIHSIATAILDHGLHIHLVQKTHTHTSETFMLRLKMTGVESSRASVPGQLSAWLQCVSSEPGKAAFSTLQVIPRTEICLKR